MLIWMIIRYPYVFIAFFKDCKKYERDNDIHK